MKWLAVLLLFMGTLMAQPGLKNDTTSNAVPSGYPNSGFTPPALNGTYIDSFTGTTVKRLTNGGTQNSNQGIANIYNTLSGLSQDNLFLLALYRGAGALAIVNVSNSIVTVPTGNMPAGVGQATIHWAGPNGTGVATTDHDFYYLNGNQLRRGTFSSTCTAPCTPTTSLLHTFTGYTSMRFMGGESDTSDDGDHLLFDAVLISNSHPYAITYTISTDTVVGQLDMNAAPAGFDNGNLFHDNRVIIGWNRGGTACGASECYYGMGLYTNALVYVRQVWLYDNHSVPGWSGANVYDFSMDGNVGVCGIHNGIAKQDLATGTVTCFRNFLGGPSSGGGQPGDSLSSKNGWVMSYVVDESSTPPNTASYPIGSLVLNTNWFTGFNELLLINIASGDFWRLVQTRACMIVSGSIDYGKYPLASLSRDGTKVTYNSDFCQNSTVDYEDVMLLNLGGGVSMQGVSISGVSVQ